jgi:hypothetical protein
LSSRHVKGVSVKGHRVTVGDGEIVEYGVITKMTFVVGERSVGLAREMEGEYACQEHARRV